MTDRTNDERHARNQAIAEEFRANGGKVGGPYEGMPLVIIHTVGAKSGLARVNPLVALVEDDTLYIFASKAGAPQNPDWYHNLVATPKITVEFGEETYEAIATELAGQQRDEIFAKQMAVAPQFAAYEQKTTRKIPVFALTRSV